MAEGLGFVEFDGEGPERKPVAITGASRDLTELKQAEELQRLLLDELKHRVKNTLATIQAIAWPTLRTARDLPSAREALDRRIRSMAQTHDVARLDRGGFDGHCHAHPRGVCSEPSEDVWCGHQRFTQAHACTVASAA